MLRNLKEIECCKVSATDGDIGSVSNFLLDDERWIIRYLVVETGDFADRQQVLISPISFRQVDLFTKQFHLALTKEKVRMSPNIDAKQPVSRQHELDYSDYYGYPGYWGDSGLWGMSDYPGSLAAERWHEMTAQNAENSADIHLHSANEIRGYQVRGSDELIGVIEDFILDDQTWEVRFLIVDTSSWWRGERVLVSPRWANRIGWNERTIHLDLSRLVVENCPKWNSNLEVNWEYETRLHEYYGRALQKSHGAPPIGRPAPHRSSSHSE